MSFDMKYIDADKLIAEIERRKGYISVTHFAEDLLAFIDSLPEEKPSEDIEQAAARYERENRQSILSSVDIVNAFIEGAEWQNEQMMDEWLKDRDGCFWDGVNEGKKAMENQMPQPEDTVIFQKGVAEGRRLEREDGGLAWQDIKSIVQIADKMLDDPKARVEYQNHNEEYYYKRVLDEYNILHKTQAE